MGSSKANLDGIQLRVEVDNEKGLTRAAYSIYGQSWDKTGYTVEQPLELRAKAVANYFMVSG